MPTRVDMCSTTDNPCETKDGQPKLSLQILKQIDDLCLHGHVERRNRLVANDEFRIESEGSRDSDSLTLTARRIHADIGRRVPVQGRPISTTLECGSFAVRDFQSRE